MTERLPFVGRAPSPAIAWSCVAALALLAGCGSREESQRELEAASRCGPDLLLLTVDTLRADHLSIYGYSRPTTPNLERWFDGAALYERAYSTESSTPTAVVSMLSGLLPQEHRVRLFYQLLADDVSILPDLLPDCYQTAAFVSNMVLTDEATGMARRFDYYDDYVTQTAYRGVFERTAVPTTDAALAWLRDERDPARALLLWVHYFDPHGPYRPPPDWPRQFRHEGHHPVGPKISPYQVQPGISDALDYVDLYDEEIRHTEAELSRLLEGYDALWPLDRALVVLTADHGEAMIERQTWFGHGYDIWEPLVRVPLLVRGPGVRPGRHSELVSVVDVPRTLLAAAGVDRATDVGFVDLRTGAGAGRERLVFTEANNGALQRRAVLQGRKKWVTMVGRQGHIIGRHFYDLETDPGESKPLPWPGDSTAATRLEDLIRSDPDPGGLPRDPKRGFAIAAAKVDPRVSPAEREKLRSLGYVE